MKLKLSINSTVNLSKIKNGRLTADQRPIMKKVRLTINK